MPLFSNRYYETHKWDWLGRLYEGALLPLLISLPFIVAITFLVYLLPPLCGIAAIAITLVLVYNFKGKI